MKLTWHGHATFFLETDSQTSKHVIVTDPNNPETSGYKPYAQAADLIVMSSDTDDFHNNEHLLPGEHEVLNALELAQTGKTYQGHGATIHAAEAMENEAHREGNPDRNALYRIEIDGLHIGHMGDIGTALSDSQTEFFAGTDVLLALAGGYPVLALDDLKKLIDTVKPKLVIPMHFQTLRLKTNDALWLGDFLEYFDKAQIDFALSSSVHLSKDELPSDTRVLVMEHL